MSDKTKIEWSESTWNPVTGCTKVSPGCDHCYAETFAERWRGVPGHPYEQGFDLKLWPERLELPLRWRKPRRVFVNSMSDLFHDGVPDEYIAQVFAVMAEAPRHTFQCLTKRPGRMCSLLNSQEFRHKVVRAIDALRVDLEHDPKEAWAPIPGFDGYEASSHGRVRGMSGILATHINPATGRENVTLWNRGEPKTLPVHRLVLLSHEPSNEGSAEVCHRNGDKRDNRLANLRWGTRSENQREKVRHGARGGPQKLNPTQVAEILEARRQGATQQAIADRFGVSRPLVSMIESGRVWSSPELQWPLRNVWLGTSVESQKWADVRIPKLLETPAAVRFLSCEPLLGPVDLRRWLLDWDEHQQAYLCQDHGVMECEQSWPCRGLGWVIVGGESGPGARPMHLAWARALVRQCQGRGAAVFVKQLGAHPYDSEAGLPWLCRSPKGGEIDEFPADLRVREYPAVAR